VGADEGNGDRSRAFKPEKKVNNYAWGGGNLKTGVALEKPILHHLQTSAGLNKKRTTLKKGGALSSWIGRSERRGKKVGVYERLRAHAER